MASPAQSPPAVLSPKLDAHLAAALKAQPETAAPDAPPKLNPDIPVQSGGRVLVEIKGTISKELLEQVALLGGTVVGDTDSVTSVRAMVPLTQLETLAGRPDIQSISPGSLTITRGVQ